MWHILLQGISKNLLTLFDNICESDKESEVVAYLRQKFPKIGKTEKKQGIFVSTNYTTILRPRL